MANFLDDLSVYNAKAAAAIALAVRECKPEKANMMSSLKATANDTTLSEDIRLEALTALINIGDLLDIPLPPYFPLTTTYANTQTFVGLHNELLGLQGGTAGEYYHLTEAEKTSILNKASLADISFANLQGVYTQNASLVGGFATKQNVLNGTGFVKANGTTITYDNSTYLTSISTIEAGGDLSGFYPSPSVTNSAVINKLLVGFNQSAASGTVSDADSILSAIEKLNANIILVSSGSGTINSVSFSLPSSVFDFTAGPYTIGAAPLSGTFINQDQNSFFAGPSGGGPGQPLFRLIEAGDFPLSGAASGTYGTSTTIPRVTVDDYGRITGIEEVTSASGGQVNTVAFNVPAGGPFNRTVTGDTDVNITLGIGTQTANTVWAGPETGAVSAPTFRNLVAADIPTGIPQINIEGLSDALANKLDASLNDGEIWIGNSATAPFPRSLTQDINITRTGVVTIQPNVVDFSKMQEITGADTGVLPNIPGNILGRWSAGVGEIQEIQLSGDFILPADTGVLSLAVPIAPVLDTKGGLITFSESIGQQVQLNAVFSGKLLMTDEDEPTGKGLKWVTAGGDIEVDPAYDGTFNIKDGVVTRAKMADLPTDTILGNNAALGEPLALSVSDVTLMLDLFSYDVTSANTGTKGLVPAANLFPLPAGKSVTDYFLRADGAWALGGGGAITGSLTITNTGGASPGAVFNGASNVTIDYSTVGAPKADGTGATGTWAISITGNAANVTGIVPLANGGTNANLTASAGSVAYSSSSAIQFTSAATQPGQLLRSGATVTNAPIWTTATYPSTTTALRILYSTSDNIIGEIAVPTDGKFLKYTTATGFSWADAGSGSGTVSNSVNANVLAHYSAPGTTVSPLAAITASRALVSDANGLPVASAVTSSELGFLTGVTSVIQTQLNGKEPTITTLPSSKGGTDNNTYTVGDILYANGPTSLVKRGIGSTGFVLSVVGGVPTWVSGLTNPMTTAGDIITGGAAGAAQRLGIGGAGTFLGVVGGVPGWTVPTGSTPLNQVTASTGAITVLHGNFTNTWSWNTNTVQNAFVLNSSGAGALTTGSLLVATHGTSALTGNLVSFSSTGVTSGNILSVAHTTSVLTGNVASFTSTTVTTGSVLNLGISGTTASSARNLVITNTSTTANSTVRGLDIQLSGNNTSGNTVAAFISNIKGGTTSTTTALQLTASGGTTISYALDVLAGISRFVAGTASTPQLVLTPSSAAGGTTFTGTVNGSLWYDTNTTNSTSSLFLYKDTSVTRLITKDRNEDFATGTSFGVIVANTQGSLFKSADLTALGIFSGTADGATLAAAGNADLLPTSAVGSKTLPANFFAAGKTIEVFVSGKITTTNSPGNLVLKLQFGATPTDIATITLPLHPSITNGYWDARFIVVCRTAGATGGISANGVARMETNANANMIYGDVVVPTTLPTINTAAAQDIKVNGAITTTNSVTIQNCYAIYLN